MDLISSLPLPAALALLALVDGLSVGTLLIPLFLVLVPGRPRIGRILVYLGTITAFYLVVGILFTLGLVNIIDGARAFLASRAGLSLALGAGVALFLAGLWLWRVDVRQKRAAAERADAGLPDPETRLDRWRDRLLDRGSGPGAIMAVALAAGLIEIAGMLPYLIGMTMIADAPLVQPARFGLLLGYCLVMIVPALVCLALRWAAAPLVERPLVRLASWMRRTGADTTSWILCIVGVLVARWAGAGLGLQLPFGSGT